MRPVWGTDANGRKNEPDGTCASSVGKGEVALGHEVHLDRQPDRRRGRRTASDEIPAFSISPSPAKIAWIGFNDPLGLSEYPTSAEVIAQPIFVPSKRTVSIL